ncbi:sugar transporter ERD6-like 5 isoform X2 [Amborella trichopoda]|uniref:sugar transporter ERD6-like 5 isoform X2 n=1 Tax=Amborella trichopoda TaxID=13333 RepID=UPI0005D38373|nr:sugar transporter ERD6-like 5 isoform X2 [Amborella trichopoda]|eukprot:XP_011623901.1 sugar transporter ERD6-like 5 isoform X2 [Amborella trichopoda]
MSASKDLDDGSTLRESEITEALISKEKSTAVLIASNSSGNDGKGSILVVILSTFVAVSGSFEFGSAVGFSSPTQSAIRSDLGLSLSEYSVFGSILTIGSMIGAIMCGSLADYVGRKGAMRIAAVFSILGWIAISFSEAAWTLDIGRLSVGYGIGVLSYVVPVYIAEITPKHLRGGFTTVNQLMIVFGASVAFILGTILTWRVLTVTGIVPCLILLLGLFIVPESPRWLAKLGRQQEFEVALRRLRGKEADISEEAVEIEEYIKTIDSLPQVTLIDLFQRKYAHPLIVGAGLIALQQFGGCNGIGFYASETFVSAGFSSTVGTIAMASIQISATGTCMGCLLVAISFVLEAHDSLTKLSPILALSGILVFSASFSIGMGGIPWVLMSEIFPINVKGTAGSLVNLVHWFGSWAMTFAYNFFMSWSRAGTFFAFSAVSAATVLFVAKLVPETKGRTLEEIQASMDHASSGKSSMH